MHHCFSSTTDYSTENNSALTNFLTDELDGEFCYIQTSDGKIVSIHHALTDNYKELILRGALQVHFKPTLIAIKKMLRKLMQAPFILLITGANVWVCCIQVQSYLRA